MEYKNKITSRHTELTVDMCLCNDENEKVVRFWMIVLRKLGVASDLNLNSCVWLGPSLSPQHHEHWRHALDDNEKMLKGALILFMSIETHTPYASTIQETGAYKATSAHFIYREAQAMPRWS